MNSEYYTFLSTYFEDREGLLIAIIMIPFWTKVFISSTLINQRDNTSKFILLLSPFKSDNYDYALESLLRFWWPAGEYSNFWRITANVFSIIFLCIISIVIINGIIELKVK